VKTTPVTPADLAASVFAVPPLARRADLSLDAAAQLRLTRHIEAGGVSTLLYGGNANLYHMGLREYPAFLDMIESISAPGTWIIPSAGPDFGKLMDQAAILRTRHFPSVMLLPMAFPAMPGGVAQAVQRFAEAIARPVILYLKTDQQMHVADIARLVDAGLVCGIKYAIPRADPADDPTLGALLDAVDRRLVACGLAERTALTHLMQFGLASYTSGGVCIAPRLATALLQAARSGDAATARRLRAAFMPLELQRETTNVFATLHAAVSLSGIADLGHCLPMLEPIGADAIDTLRGIVADLVDAEAALPR
jgi:dihydrodipicolinate synthase/N-acetylneuraminate lyase